MNNFEELSIAENIVLKGSLNKDLIDKLRNEIEDHFSFAYDTSEKYGKDEDHQSYLFRTPTSLETPAIGPGYQFMPLETDTMVVFRTHLIEAILQAKNKMYKINEYWALLQTDEEWIQNPVHQHLTADSVAVVYISVNPGDSIDFKNNDESITESYLPSEGDLLIFNGDAYHKPNKNTGTKHRISLNMELGLVDGNR